MILTDIKGYDGHLLHQRFAYQYFRENVNPLGDIIAFRGWMRVEAEGMIDQEDLLNKDYIYSQDALNFLWEIPGLAPFGAVAFQRLFNHEIGTRLAKILGKTLEMRGDDIYIIDGGKASVSITHVKDGAALGHTAINIIAGDEAPVFAYSTQLNSIQAEQFMQQVIELFYAMTKDIFIATTKVLTK